MIEPHMILAILSLQKTCERPSSPKDEEAFYQQYSEPFYQRVSRAYRQLYRTFRGRRPSYMEVQAAHSLKPDLEACR